MCEGLVCCLLRRDELRTHTRQVTTTRLEERFATQALQSLPACTLPGAVVATDGDLHACL